ncbi:hypothetical protein ASG31_08530 [Chryseobacterium sp. Leaf404]|uniref:TIGR01777 family oxidoreductase n=1 Tax=unclassified Chryseobacterium TaxID=2593645 RepID=UPI0006F9F48A|nr:MULTISPECIES: TIGR01777 family oxidoreductase [unclassified Chryseobacterium]KQT17446.1 hypothetical protein ASG31_08530 [Chryseobacterium sp. Leaf404]
MKETVLITGAGGSIARKLAERLQNDFEVRFLTRKKKNPNDFQWDLENKTIDEKALENVRHIIHLAGANIAEKKWTPERKQEIIKSRTDSAELLLNTLKQKNIILKSFISASGINYYGTVTTEKIFTENDPSGSDFLSKVVVLWEKSADAFKDSNVAERVVKLRTAVVLTENEGALPKLAAPIKFGVGSPVGSGNQYMPWIHIDDICGMYEFALKNNNVSGAYNAVAPEHATNKILSKKIAEILKKPFFMPNVPGFVLKMMFGELSVALLEGSRASSEKIQKAGFAFHFPQLKGALEDLLKK